MPDEHSALQVPYPPAVDPRAFASISDADVERIAVAVVRRMMIAEANISIAKTDALIAEGERKWW
jgi:hypothetical protein